MRVISDSTLELLASKQVQFFEANASCLLVKSIGADGNRIPGWKSSPVVMFTDATLTVSQEIVSDCPLLQVSLADEGYRLTCWNWVPGPGPGDFEQTYATEAELLEAILNYFFETNPYFEARKHWEMQQMTAS